MIRIEPEAWKEMVRHAEATFPKECCGVMIGAEENGARRITLAVACRNAYEGDQKDRFHIDGRDQVAAERRARELGLDVIGYFHSHPNEDAYFSSTDLKHSWPWYSNVVMSVRGGVFSHAKSFIANDDQTAAEPEDLHY
ncbi:MAG: M67 family metallopeptidase [Acidimicrobiia bacterium]|nr:M67 family metallopeptidase [Acidimicrobiia bacterium]